jgi:uncharacterized protein
MGAPTITAREGAALAALAVSAVAARLLDRPFAPPEPSSPALRAEGASFVTLERGGALRGCIGALDPVRPLFLDVARNARRAMTDPRLPALTAREWPDLDVTVSVLGRPEPLPAVDLPELVSALRVGVDGLILVDGQRRATFLPTVWKKLPDPSAFIAALLAKGGWSSTPFDQLAALRYEAVEFHDRAPRGGLADHFSGDRPPRPGADGPLSQGAVSPKDAA